MNTSPSMDDVLEGIISAIDTDIMGSLDNPKAQATAAMIQSLLQGMRQQLPVYDAILAEEHNDMTVVLRTVADQVGAADGEAADRIRERAATLGAQPDLPQPPVRAEVMAAHRELSQALEQTMIDLDVLQRAGNTDADAALMTVRGHLGPRYMRDVEVNLAQAGMIGRG